jgi:predicted nucleic acid-binding protein
MAERFVPDASVILKWVLPPEKEPHADTARALRDCYVRGDCDLMVPSLWLFEVGNILSLKFPAHAGAMLDAIHALDMSVFEGDASWRSTILRLVATYGVTFYDASYHATALATQSVLVSADARYLRHAEDAGATCFLGDWAAP